MVPLPFPSLEIYIYQLVESMIDPQKSIALDSASVMASDRKTEKEVSADSATSLLSEEAMAQEEEQLLKLREDEEKAKYLFFSFFLMKAKKVVTAKKELLALSERIGTVNTGLTEEDVKSHLKTRTCSVINLAEESPSSPQTKDKTEPCTIC
ncbi:unnamed protein product [Brassica oleracea var. botrytis]|uniref:RING-type E3 ubiquitin transferase n=2 Tax=Brassica TaxID=3705 RepID=A0A816KPN5_BRANA|nr:unnamed protein product [Brassica napus]